MAGGLADDNNQLGDQAVERHVGGRRLGGDPSGLPLPATRGRGAGWQLGRSVSARCSGRRRSTGRRRSSGARTAANCAGVVERPVGRPGGVEVRLRPSKLDQNRKVGGASRLRGRTARHGWARRGPSHVGASASSCSSPSSVATTETVASRTGRSPWIMVTRSDSLPSGRSGPRRRAGRPARSGPRPGSGRRSSQGWVAWRPPCAADGGDAAAPSAPRSPSPGAGTAR